MNVSIFVPWIAAHAAFLGILLVRNIVSRVAGGI